MDLAGHSAVLADYSQRDEDSVAAQETRAPGGVFKTLTELCVEADENTLKVNGPLRLCSPSYWLHVAAMTLLLQSEYHSRSPSSHSDLKTHRFKEYLTSPSLNHILSHIYLPPLMCSFLEAYKTYSLYFSSSLPLYEPSGPQTF